MILGFDKNCSTIITMLYILSVKPNIQVYPLLSYPRHIYYNNIQSTLLIVLQNNKLTVEFDILPKYKF